MRPVQSGHGFFRGLTFFQATDPSQRGSGNLVDPFPLSFHLVLAPQQETAGAQEEDAQAAHGRKGDQDGGVDATCLLP